MGCGCLSAGLHACTTTPITDRRQLRLIPESKLNAQAAQLYEKVKQKAKLSDDKESLNKIIEIGSKIETSISEYFYKNNMDDPTTNFSWEYILIDNKKVKKNTVNISTMVENGLISKNDLVKVLGNGEIKSSLTVEAHGFSKSAKEAIEKAGGEIKVI